MDLQLGLIENQMPSPRLYVCSVVKALLSSACSPGGYEWHQPTPVEVGLLPLVSG